MQAWRLVILLKMRLQHRCFPVLESHFNFVFMTKFLKTLFYRTLPVHYTLTIEFFERLWVENWHFSYFLCPCFVFLHNTWLFRTCFHTKSFSKCNFCTHYNIGSSTILIESLKFRNNCRITVTSPSNLLWKKLSVWVFWILCFAIISL